MDSSGHLHELQKDGSVPEGITKVELDCKPSCPICYGRGLITRSKKHKTVTEPCPNAKITHAGEDELIFKSGMAKLKERLKEVEDEN